MDEAYLALIETPVGDSGEVEHDYLVSLHMPEAETVTVGEQGPRGPVGPPGSAEGAEQSPVFTYSGGRVSRIDYASGAYKLFTYMAGELTQLDYVTAAKTVRKTFTYNPDGSLASIVQVDI